MLKNNAASNLGGVTLNVLLQGIYDRLLTGGGLPLLGLHTHLITPALLLLLKVVGDTVDRVVLRVGYTRKRTQIVAALYNGSHRLRRGGERFRSS